jgi:hypothetical protein
LTDDQFFASTHGPSHRALPIRNRYKDVLGLELFRGAFGNNGNNGDREKKCHSPSDALATLRRNPFARIPTLPGQAARRRTRRRPLDLGAGGYCCPHDSYPWRALAIVESRWPVTQPLHIA